MGRASLFRLGIRVVGEINGAHPQFQSDRLGFLFAHRPGNLSVYPEENALTLPDEPFSDEAGVVSRRRDAELSFAFDGCGNLIRREIYGV